MHITAATPNVPYIGHACLLYTKHNGDDNKTKFREVIFKREILIENKVSHNASTSVSVLLIFIYK